MKNKNAQQGVAMVEVLIAMLVMAFGFLALLKLQVTSLNNVTASNQRYVAASLAQTMGERIKANKENISSYDDIDTSTFTAVCTGENSAGCIGYTADIHRWKESLEKTSGLSGARGVIDIEDEIINIQILWSEKQARKGVTDAKFELEFYL